MKLIESLKCIEWFILLTHSRTEKEITHKLHAISLACIFKVIVKWIWVIYSYNQNITLYNYIILTFLWLWQIHNRLQIFSPLFVFTCTFSVLWNALVLKAKKFLYCSSWYCIVRFVEPSDTVRILYITPCLLNIFKSIIWSLNVTEMYLNRI